MLDNCSHVTFSKPMLGEIDPQCDSLEKLNGHQRISLLGNNVTNLVSPVSLRVIQIVTMFKARSFGPIRRPVILYISP